MCTITCGRALLTRRSFSASTDEVTVEAITKVVCLAEKLCTKSFPLWDGEPVCVITENLSVMTPTTPVSKQDLRNRATEAMADIACAVKAFSSEPKNPFTIEWKYLARQGWR